ncbi:ABC transporter ATP-binding protein [Mycoplasmopsis iners]|uniref:ABC transporter ATP-binding protein n=1 Tax=Mycoplasmopsis iners TaxID=76630 RepID=UPI000ACC666D|nr:ABC transporter ATP-binding protein [Mycoplasmopsis iners]
MKIKPIKKNYKIAEIERVNIRKNSSTSEDYAMMMKHKKQAQKLAELTQEISLTRSEDKNNEIKELLTTLEANKNNSTNEVEKTETNNQSVFIKPKDEISNPQGYSKKFHQPIIWKTKEQPKDLLIVRKDEKNSLGKRFIDFWKNLFHSTKNTFIKLLQLLRIKKAPKANQALIDFQQNIENAKEEIVFGKKVKVAAEIEDVYLTFKNPANPKEKNLVLRGVSLKVYEGMVHAIIGESGSGKSVITSLLYGLTGSNAIIEAGKVKLYGMEVQAFNLYNWEKSKLRGNIVSAVFQNPMSILDPTMKVGKQIMEGMLINKIVKNKKEAYQEALKYLEMTKINNPEKVMKLYPHELSGGMIQRIAIASIISLKPKILVMDEPTTALDPTVQALVLDIIRELQEKFKIAIVFITHDLGVVSSISDFINIMYAGQIVESGTKEEILINPQHPYTWGLIVSMPDFNKDTRLQVIRGAVPSSLNNIKGDAFAVRNDYALGIDFETEPDFYQISPTHFVKSNLLNEQSPEYQPPKIIKNLWAKYEKALIKINHSTANTFVDKTTYEHYLQEAKLHNEQVEATQELERTE